jgi:hypothetical protein
MIDIPKILSFVTSPELTGIFFPFNWILGVMGIGMLVFIIWVIWKTNWKNFLLLYDITEFFTYRAYGTGSLQNRWKDILKRLETANEEEYKLSVIEADNMLDVTLQRIGFAGETLADRLGKVNVAIVPNLPEVREANRIRNNIVHDPSYRLTLNEARKVIEIYQATFQNLDLIS